jgi:hypothetical protein
MNDKIRYAHVSVVDGVPLTRRATIGYKFNDDGQSIDYAIAQVAPGDTFTRSRGRQIVDGRLKKGGNKSNGVMRVHTMPVPADMKGYEIVQELARKHLDTAPASTPVY